jgi:hypothetical protein
MSHSLFGKLKRLVGELGPVGALAYGLHRLGGRTGGVLGLSRYLFVAQPVAAAPLLPARRGRSIEVRRLDPQDPVLLGLPLDRAVLAYRAGQGAVCFGAFKDGGIIGCLWLCLGAYEEDEVRCRYLPQPGGQASWDFDVYLLPEQRSGLGFARLWDEANAFLRAQGVSYSWSRISAFNPGSLAAHSRLGARVLGQATFLWLGPCQLMLGSVPPYRHLSFRVQGRPTLELHNP